MGKKSEPPMWPAVDHIHILSDLSLPGVNGGRAIQTRGPCYLLNNRDTESSRGRVAKQHMVLGSRGGQESHPVKQESRGECTVPPSCEGTSHPGHQHLQFGLLFPCEVCLVTHTTLSRTPLGGDSCLVLHASAQRGQLVTTGRMFFPWAISLLGKMILWGGQG